MRWYFSIDEAGSLRQPGTDARRAVLTAAAHGGLEPRLLYYGKRNDFTAWMAARGVDIIDTAPSFINALNTAQAAGTYTSHSIGHWLRLEIPQVEQRDDEVLYTDCDVIFLRPHNWAAVKPNVFAAAPEFKPDNWNYFNSGVMVLNVPTMRATYAAFAAHITARLQAGVNYNDQWALNEAYRAHWQRLDPVCNWKPYWPFNRNAALLHFHGPKLDGLEAIATNRWPRDNPTAIQLAKMFDAHAENYLAWCNHLGDALQSIDLPTALRLSRIASALINYRSTLAPVEDRSFMDFKMFPE